MHHNSCDSICLKSTGTRKNPHAAKSQHTHTHSGRACLLRYLRCGIPSIPRLPFSFLPYLLLNAPDQLLSSHSMGLNAPSRPPCQLGLVQHEQAHDARSLEQRKGERGQRPAARCLTQLKHVVCPLVQARKGGEHLGRRWQGAGGWGGDQAVSSVSYVRSSTGARDRADITCM